MKNDINYTLFNPGPSNIHQNVIDSLSAFPMCHREEEFFEIYDDCRKMVLQIANVNEARYDCIFLTCSGTGANEAVVSSFLPVFNQKILVIDNGVYGDRLNCQLNFYNISHQTMKFEAGDKINIKALEQVIKKHEIIALVLVHHETTTGLLNDLEELKDIIKKYNLFLFIDAISSFGVEDINFDKYNIVALTCTSNKCIQGIPGISFVIFNIKLLNDTRFSSNGTYFNLHTYYDKFKTKSFPFTPATYTFYAFHTALTMLIDETVENRRKKYKERKEIIINGLTALGYKLYLPRENYSNVLVSFYLKENQKYVELHKKLKEKHFIIYSGQLDLPIFRISFMAEVELEEYYRLIRTFKELKWT